MTSTNNPKLSIVTTLYYSSRYIEEFYTRITKEANKITDSYEIIFVDDGSPDDSLQKAIEIHNKDPKVKVIELSRNFGHHKAIMTGLSFAKGDYIFLIDVDLEEQPELLGKFWEEIHKYQDTDVVYGIQEKRKGNLLDRITGEIFYTIFSFISSTKIPRNFMTVRLMKKKYCQSLIKHKERETIIAGLFSITGFKQRAVKIEKYKRFSTSYSLIKRISVFVNAITSFSNVPLILIFWVGIVVSLISFTYALWIIYRKIVYGIPIEGWSSIMVAILTLGGIILISLGIIGIYLSKVFIETKQRPYTIIREIYQKKELKNYEKSN
ncbi:MAG: glycosyltransferase family 2 protein [Candidatus Calescibacterium sp.]|nr:glycosyltransferase family 2 protein [Candidatus Calescibacterium sp.]